MRSSAKHGPDDEHTQAECSRDGRHATSRSRQQSAWDDVRVVESGVLRAGFRRKGAPARSGHAANARIEERIDLVEPGLRAWLDGRLEFHVAKTAIEVLRCPATARSC